MSDPVAIDEFVTVEAERPPHRLELHAREERRASSLVSGRAPVRGMREPSTRSARRVLRPPTPYH
jgi:hypothetical protein